MCDVVPLLLCCHRWRRVLETSCLIRWLSGRLLLASSQMCSRGMVRFLLSCTDRLASIEHTCSVSAAADGVSTQSLSATCSSGSYWTLYPLHPVSEGAGAICIQSFVQSVSQSVIHSVSQSFSQSVSQSVKFVTEVLGPSAVQVLWRSTLLCLSCVKH